MTESTVDLQTWKCTVEEVNIYFSSLNFRQKERQGFFYNVDNDKPDTCNKLNVISYMSYILLPFQ